MERYLVEGMTCSACSAHVERAVGKLDFVRSVRVSLLSNSMTVETTDGAPHAAQIEAAVREAGYAANPERMKDETVHAQSPDDPARPLLRRFVASLCLLMPLMWLSMQHMAGWWLPPMLDSHIAPMGNALGQLLLALPVLLINRAYFVVGFKRLARLSPNMDSLIAVGSAASFLYGLWMLFAMAWAYAQADVAAVHQAAAQLYFESAAMILTLITLGKYFEARAKRRTTAEIEKLMRMAPDTATLSDADGERIVPTESLKVGDVLLIRPGERIPVDGELLDDDVAVDEAHITGESLPVDKRTGDALASGSMSLHSAFRMRATKVGADTTLSRIIALVREAGDSKAPIAKLADRVSGVFVPIVMGLALLTLGIWLAVGQPFAFSLSRAVAVLVISCPCALGLATPVAIMAGTGAGARNGVLFRNGEVLETLHHVQSIVLDKTGTLTEGRMTARAVVAAEGVTEAELLSLAISLERMSEHPVARAVAALCEERGARPREAAGFRNEPGRGVSAMVEGERCLAGNAKWLTENGVALPDAPLLHDGEGLTELLFARGARLMGAIGVSDTLKPASAAAISEMKRLHVVPVLLTGDRREAAQAIAAEAGIETVLWEVTPGEKARKVRELQQAGQRVAMVGDGVNDAPALKQADVGIAVGGGTDVALETSDVVLASGSLSDVPTAIRLSRAVIRIIRENLFWAFFYNVVGIPVAAGALYPAFGIVLSPMLGAAAMSLSSVCVVSNALRLKRFRAERVNTGEPSPTPLEHQKEENNMEKTILIEGMSCNHCKMSVEKALGAVAGVKSVQVSLEAKRAVVTGEALDESKLREAVVEAGFEVAGVR